MPGVLNGNVGGTVYHLAEPAAVVIAVRAIVNRYAVRYDQCRLAVVIRKVAVRSAVGTPTSALFVQQVAAASFW